MLGDVDEVGHGVVAEDEVDMARVVPAVEMFGVREGGGAAQEDAAKAATQAGGTGPIEGVGGAFVGRTIAGAVDEAHEFAGVGEGDDEGMVAPGAVVGDADAVFVLGVGGDQGAVGVEDGAVEEGIGLASPDVEADLVEDVLERVDRCFAEASAKVAGGGGIGNALGVEGIEEVDVVAAQLDVLQTSAIAQRVEGDVENVIGFIIGQMNLEEMESAIDGVDEADAACQEVKGADAAMADGVGALGDFVVDVAGGEDRPLAADGPGFVEPLLDSALVSLEATT